MPSDFRVSFVVLLDPSGDLLPNSGWRERVTRLVGELRELIDTQVADPDPVFS